jgi:hypothetical protein
MGLRRTGKAVPYAGQGPAARTPASTEECNVGRCWRCALSRNSSLSPIFMLSSIPGTRQGRLRMDPRGVVEDRNGSIKTSTANQRKSRTRYSYSPKSTAPSRFPLISMARSSGALSSAADFPPVAAAPYTRNVYGRPLYLVGRSRSTVAFLVADNAFVRELRPSGGETTCTTYSPPTRADSHRHVNFAASNLPGHEGFVTCGGLSTTLSATDGKRANQWAARRGERHSRANASQLARAMRTPYP